MKRMPEQKKRSKNFRDSIVQYETALKTGQVPVDGAWHGPGS